MLITELADIGFETAVKQVSEKEYTISTRSLSNEEYTILKHTITNAVGEYEIKEYQSFSSSISTELLYKAIIALIVAIIVIILYISFVFRKSSRPIASWKYGMAATLALIHDTIIPLGLFAILAPFTTATVDTLFVTALLATLGYSINDTIVVFDRMRDRLQVNREKNRKEDFNETIDYGVKNSLRRSVYTSVSTVTPLVLLFIFVSANQVVQYRTVCRYHGRNLLITLFCSLTVTVVAAIFPAERRKRKATLRNRSGGKNAARHCLR